MDSEFLWLVNGQERAPVQVCGWVLYRNDGLHLYMFIWPAIKKWWIVMYVSGHWTEMMVSTCLWQVIGQD